ncbi:MAG: monovalent cation/H+ antiporter complex subunit F [Acidilobaceae archaeon]
MNSPWEQVLLVSVLVYVISIIVHSYRVFIGPTISDRVLALDCITYAFLALLVVLSLMMRYWLFLHIALIIAVFVFVLDVVVARYLEEDCKKCLQK